MNDERVLRLMARAAMLTGRLPLSVPDRVWGGPGSGAPCTLCGNPIERHEVEIEVDLGQQADGSGTLTCHFHRACFAAWRREREQLGSAGMMGSANQTSGGSFTTGVTSGPNSPSIMSARGLPDNAYDASVQAGERGITHRSERY